MSVLSLLSDSDHSPQSDGTDGTVILLTERQKEVCVLLVGADALGGPKAESSKTRDRAAGGVGPYTPVSRPFL
jgi:hypothetical protein